MEFDGLLVFSTGSFPLAAFALAVVIVGLVLRLLRRRPSSSTKTISSRKLEKHPWLLQFPPSRRHTLADLKLNKDSPGPHLTPSPDILYKHALPSTRTANWDQKNLFTPTGFSTEDIRALGRFPDYSVLTGTRYPQPYGAHFDINKAIFRPFRPFRWTYHQTMGKSCTRYWRARMGHLLTTITSLL